MSKSGLLQTKCQHVVPLFNILVQLPAETSRHACHADILREVLDGVVGTDAESMAEGQHDPVF